MPGHTHQARIVPVGEVRTGAAVNVDIHQPRDHQRPVQILRRARDILQHMGKPPVFHREASPDEPSVRKIQPFSYRISRTSRGPATALIFIAYTISRSECNRLSGRRSRNRNYALTIRAPDSKI